MLQGLFKVLLSKNRWIKLRLLVTLQVALELQSMNSKLRRVHVLVNIIRLVIPIIQQVLI